LPRNDKHEDYLAHCRYRWCSLCHGVLSGSIARGYGTAYSYFVVVPLSFPRGGRALHLLKERADGAVAVFVYVGIAASVIGDVVVSATDRNMFPFEIIWWAGLLASAVLSGVVVAWSIQARKAKG
jgi:hypothetical protein